VTAGTKTESKGSNTEMHESMNARTSMGALQKIKTKLDLRPMVALAWTKKIAGDLAVKIDRRR
jgi:hypothetical protein